MYLRTELPALLSSTPPCFVLIGIGSAFLEAQQYLQVHLDEIDIFQEAYLLASVSAQP